MCSAPIAVVLCSLILIQNLIQTTSLKFIDGFEYIKSVDPRVSTNNGVIEGRINTTKTGFEYLSFRGIPYAKPPIGELRFRDPKPVENWDGILDVTELRNSCTQLDKLITFKYYGEEDCLYLNVYVPKVAERHEPFPVMIWIHGGGFILGDGSSDIYGPEFLVEKNVTIVTINYRLGVFGFLSLNFPEVPGNAGLKDQSLALKWIKENIHHFNGDANKITIFGESAGAASVHYHMFSPMSRGLYHKAILESGTANCAWTLQPDPEKIAFKLAENIGLITDSKDEVVAFLRTVPKMNLTYEAISPKMETLLTFAPSVEQIFPNTEAFITRTPQDYLGSGDFENIPVIVGLTTVEGLIFRTPAFENPADTDAINNNQIPDLYRFVPQKIKAKYGEKGVEEIVTEIREFYFPKNANISEGLIKLYSDFYFVKDIVEMMTIQSNKSSPVFYYEFAYSGNRNFLRFLTNFTYNNAAHIDEIGYLFDIKIHGMDQLHPTESDTLVIERMVKLWTNFAKYGNPTPDKTEVLPIIWNPIKPTEVVCLRIYENLNMTENPFEKSVKFWKCISEM